MYIHTKVRYSRLPSPSSHGPPTLWCGKPHGSQLLACHSDWGQNPNQDVGIASPFTVVKLVVVMGILSGILLIPLS